jgi:aspartate-semialdehyde dehydrogenase
VKSYRIAVVGASGAVGREVVKTLVQRRFPFSSLKLFTSPRSAGQAIEVGGSKIRFEALGDAETFAGLDIVFFTSGSSVSEKHAFRAAKAGALVIDNASVFRMRPDVPLVVPEVNGQTLSLAQHTRVVANPNCTTAQMVMALKPLHDRFRVTRVVLASYQAVSGKGQKGIEEFERQIGEFAAGKKPTASAFPHPIAFNCLPHIDVFRPDGFTGEEHTVMEETRKILGDDSMRVVATCVRVPVLNCHSESVTIEIEKPATVESAREALRAMPGVRLVDDPSQNEYPLAMDVSGQDDVAVGRVRIDPSLPPGRHGLTFWVVGDNLRKGAALNAVQIAEEAIRRQIIQ